MSDPKNVSAEGGFKGIIGLRLLKVVTFVRSVIRQLLFSTILCHAVEVTVFAVELAAAFAVQWSAASLGCVVASAAGCDVRVAWAGLKCWLCLTLLLDLHQLLC